MRFSLSYIVNNKWYLLISLFALVLPFGSALPNIMYAVLLFFWILDVFQNKIQFDKTSIKWLVILTAFYFFYVVTISYSENLAYALKKAKLQSILAVTPLIYLTIKEQLNEKKVINILQLSIFSTTVFTLLSFCGVLFQNLKLQTFSIASFSENHLSQGFVDLHYLEFSLLVAFIINIYVFIRLFKKQYLHHIILKLCLPILLFLIVILILINSVSSIIITFGILFIQMLFYFKKKNNKKPILILCLLTVICLGINYEFNKKFKDNVNDVVLMNNNEQWGGRGMRLLIWNASSKVIKNHPFFGVGIGDQNDELTLTYKKYRYGQLLYMNNNFNAHNIVLQSLICSGIIGCVLFLGALVLPAIESIKKNNYMYLVFCSIFILSGMVNSFLQVNFGITFFAFFNSLLFILNFYNEGITNP